jgi:hypothetical protein
MHLELNMLSSSTLLGRTESRASNTKALLPEEYHKARRERSAVEI